MYMESTAINLYFALTGNLQTSTILLVVFMFHWARAVATVWYPQETGKANKNVSDWNVQQSPGG
jgi:hypothetical protein